MPICWLRFVQRRAVRRARFFQSHLARPPAIDHPWLWLNGMTYGRISAGSEKDSWQNIYNLVQRTAHGSAYSADIFTRLEDYYRKLGYPRPANSFFRAQKKREREEVLTGLRLGLEFFSRTICRLRPQPRTRHLLERGHHRDRLRDVSTPSHGTAKVRIHRAQIQPVLVQRGCLPAHHQTARRRDLEAEGGIRPDPRLAPHPHHSRLGAHSHRPRRVDRDAFPLDVAKERSDATVLFPGAPPLEHRVTPHSKICLSEASSALRDAAGTDLTSQ